MSAKELKSALLRQVGDRLVPLGFEARSREQAFVRAISGGRATCHLAFIDHPDDVDVVCDVAVRFDALEDLVNASNRLLSTKEKSRTHSLGAELGNLAGVGQKRWTLRPAADIAEVAAEIVAAFRAIGVPYLERASTLEGAYELLTAAGKAAWIHSPMHAARSKRVVGLAKLLGKQDEIARYVEQCERLLEDLGDPGIADFRRFVSSISSD